ncbi:MAG: UPF0175 family protein [Sedimenticola sp.]
MKTIGVRALRENPGVLNQSAQSGEIVLLTNRSQPMSLSIPFDDYLLSEGVHVDIAVKLLEEGAVTLVKAAKLAKMPVESFMEKLALLGVVVVDQTEEEFEKGMKIFED